MNNEDRDKMIQETRDAVLELKANSHSPITCPRAAVHEESHGRHVRWFFWSIGAGVGVGGLILGIVRILI